MWLGERVERKVLRLSGAWVKGGGGVGGGGGLVDVVGLEPCFVFAIGVAAVLN